MLPLPPSPQCWALSDGRAGHAIQAAGLARALGLRTIVQTVPMVPFPWFPKRRDAAIWAARSLASGGESPAVLISCGRRATAPALALRRRLGERVFSIHIHDPGVDPRAFDLVITPAHDRVRGGNVLTVLGALGRLDAATLRAAGAQRASTLTDLPRPWLVVLLGGPSRAFRFDAGVAQRLAADLTAAARDCGGSLLVTTSRRTGTENAALFRAAFSPLPGRFHDGADVDTGDAPADNPYPGWLGAADAALVSADSVTMLSEACAIGRSVHILPLPPRWGPRNRTAKMRRFHTALVATGHARPFDGRLSWWTSTPLEETRRVAVEIRRRLAARGMI